MADGSPSERIIIGPVQALVQGLTSQASGNERRTVLMNGDGSLVIHSRMMGVDASGQRQVAVDPSGFLRTRPYEPIRPVVGGPMPSTTATMHTAGYTERVMLEVVNNDGGNNTAGVRISNTANDVTVVPLGLEIPVGIGIRLGPYDLESGWTIKGSSSPGNSVDLHVIRDAHAAVGDTP